jgi:hypothetical protein
LAPAYQPRRGRRTGAADRDLFAGLLPEHVREHFRDTFDDWWHGGPPPDGLNEP